MVKFVSNSRVNYVEPNLRNDGRDLPSNVEDMNIIVDLMVTTVSRFSKVDSTEFAVPSEDYTYKLTWLTGEEGATSFLQGRKLDMKSPETYLTTYYTDITYNDVKHGEVTEAIGMTEVNIDYDSYYMPKVVIKFSDVRGASMLVPNEYQSTEQENDENIVNGFFKCFMTFPYPIFMLRVKGFYGNAVTYRLNCSKFDASFNGDTGNFEIVVDFIGYNYSFLADIQMSYLFAAPYDTYAGRDYWQEHVRNDPRWRFSDGQPMITLLDLENKISKAVIDMDTISKRDSRVRRINELSENVSLLRNIKANYSALVKDLSDLFQGEVVSCRESTQIAFFTTPKNVDKATDEISIPEPIQVLWNRIISDITAYNATNPPEKLPFLNDITTACNSAAVVTKVIENDKVIARNTNEGDDYKKWKTFRFNNDIALDDGLSNKLASIYKEEAKKSGGIKKYMYVLETHDLWNICDMIAYSYTGELKELEKYFHEFMLAETKKMVGFTPTIKNVSRIFFAHLETFMHSLYTCRGMVNGNKRVLDEINANSDIAFQNGNQQTPPFPGVYVKNKNDVFVDGWIADIAGNNVEEAQLIYGFNRAINKVNEVQKINEDLNAKAAAQNNFYPFSLIDLALEQNPFNAALDDNDTVGKFISRLGLRAFTVLSTQNVPSREAGILDALNYYQSTSFETDRMNDFLGNMGIVDGEGVRNAVNSIDSFLKHVSGGNPFANKSTNGSEIYEYEMLGDGKGLYEVSNNNSLILNAFRLNDDDNTTILPINVKNFNGRNGYVTDYVAGGKYVIPSKTSIDNSEFYSPLDQVVIKDSASPEEWMSDYTSPARFLIVEAGSEHGKWIMTFYDRVKDGITISGTGISVNSSSIFKKSVWNIDNDDSYLGFFNHNEGIVTNDRSYESYDDNSLPQKVYDDAFIEKNDLKYDFKLLKDKWWDGLARAMGLNGTFPYNLYGSSSSSEVLLGDGNFYLPKFVVNKEGTENELSLFGSLFYYLQNEPTYRDGDKLVTRSEDLIIKSKAFLYLHTICRMRIDAFRRMIGYKISLLPKAAVLFLGAMLWRRRYCIDNGPDDVLVYESIENPLIKYRYPSGKAYRPFCYAIAGSDASGSKNSVLGIEIYRQTGSVVTLYNAITHEELFGADIWNLDRSLENALIQYFETWAVSSDGFYGIMKTYEIRGTNNKVLTANEFSKLVEGFSNVLKEYNPKISNEPFKYVRDNFTSNIIESYFNFYPIHTNELMLYNREMNSGGYEISKRLLKDKVYMITTSRHYLSTADELSVKESDLHNYMINFLSTISKLTSSDIASNSNPNTADPKETAGSKDLYIAMYQYFKKLHDAWMIGKAESVFSVTKMFEDLFLFVDSFYNDTSDDIIINCEYLLELMKQSTNEYSLFSFLSKLYAQHGCLFISIPHYTDWTDKDSIAEIFTPIPYMDAETRDTNRFFVMYMHEPSKYLNNNSGDNGKYGWKRDGFLCYDPNKPEEATLETFSTRTDSTAMMIPSFGVAFAKQNQTYFKNLHLDMKNPMVTEASINAMNQIAKLGGNAADKKAAFWGQDLYKVWSNYSYQCNFEMMGCAQVQPLMYFQLLNVPLYRGTYIITHVSHNIMPGYMTTNVSGYRLAKYGKPFTNEAFGFFNSINRKLYNIGEMIGIDGDITNPNDRNGLKKISNPVANDMLDNYGVTNPEDRAIDPNVDCPDCLCVTDADYVGMHENAKRVFLALRDTVHNRYGDKWDVCITSGKRNGTGSSYHNIGLGVDIGIRKPNGSMDSKSELAIVFDILLSGYESYLYELIWESKKLNDSTEAAPNNCVHMAVRDDFTAEKPYIKVFQAYNQGKVKITAAEALSENFLYSVAKKYYGVDEKIIRQKVLSLSNYHGDVKELLSQYYGSDGSENNVAAGNLLMLSAIHGDSSSGYNTGQNNEVVKTFEQKVRNLANKYGFDPNWLMLFMYSESGLDTKAINRNAVGLIQFLPSTATYLGSSTSEILNMNASQQMNLVAKYFDKVNEGNNLYGKFTKPEDLKLFGFAPSKFANGSLNNDNAIVYDNVTVRQVRSDYYRKCREAAKKYNFENQLDRVLARKK